MISKRALKNTVKYIKQSTRRAEACTDIIITKHLKQQADIFLNQILIRLIMAADLRGNIDLILPVEAEANCYLNVVRAAEQTLAYYDVPAPNNENEDYDFPSLMLQTDILAYSFRNLQEVEKIEQILKEAGYSFALCPNNTLIQCQYFLKIIL